MSSRSSLKMLTLLTAVGVSTASCSDGTGLRADMAALSGTYVAGPPSAGSSAVVGVFTTTQNGVTTNMLEAGATIRLVLSADGQTSGRLLVPGELDANLAGAWALQGDVVTLSHEADTFLRDMELRASNGRLEDQRVFPDVTVRVVLQRVP